MLATSCCFCYSLQLGSAFIVWWTLIFDIHLSVKLVNSAFEDNQTSNVQQARIFLIAVLWTECMICIVGFFGVNRRKKNLLIPLLASKIVFFVVNVICILLLLLAFPFLKSSQIFTEITEQFNFLTPAEGFDAALVVLLIILTAGMVLQSYVITILYSFIRERRAHCDGDSDYHNSISSFDDSQSSEIL